LRNRKADAAQEGTERRVPSSSTFCLLNSPCRSEEFLHLVRFVCLTLLVGVDNFLRPVASDVLLEWELEHSKRGTGRKTRLSKGVAHRLVLTLVVDTFRMRHRQPQIYTLPVHSCFDRVQVLDQ